MTAAKDQWVIIDLRPLRDYVQAKKLDVNAELKNSFSLLMLC